MQHADSGANLVNWVDDSQLESSIALTIVSDFQYNAPIFTTLHRTVLGWPNMPSSADLPSPAGVILHTILSTPIHKIQKGCSARCS